VSLAEARKRARHAFAAIDDGRDPAGEQQAAKARPMDAIAALAEEYIAKYARIKQRRWKEEERILSVYVLPLWKDRSVREIMRRDVRALVTPIVNRSPIMANRVLSVVRRALNYGIRNDWLDANPPSLMDRPGKEVSRERVLTDEEIRRVWRLLSRQPSTAERAAPGRKRSKGAPDDPICPVAPALADAIKMRLLTAQRGGEVINMRWRDLDLDAGWWTIPGEFAKNGRAHRVPLVAEAIAIVKAGEGRKVGPKARTPRAGGSGTNRVRLRGNGCVDQRPCEESSITSHACSTSSFGDTTFVARLPRRWRKLVCRGITFSAVLNHVEGGARGTRIYDRYNYDAEKRRALEMWAVTLKSIVESEDPGKVLPFSTSVNR
jgi:integrase